MSILIRPETARDVDAITLVNDLAFGRQQEGKLVADLRRGEVFIPELSLVAEVEGRVVGHILFTHLPIVTAAGEVPSLALAPMAVIPGFQRKGIGSRLVGEGLREAGTAGHRSVIVLGHPGYYPRFGFAPASRWGIRAPFVAPNAAFMALELVPGALTGIRGTVRYPPAFDGV